MNVTSEDRGTALELSLEAEPAAVAEARHAISGFAREHGANADDVALAVSEAVSNAVIHAFPGSDAGVIDVSAVDDGKTLVVSVSDDGVGLRPNPESPGLGLGLALIGSLSDGVEMREDGDGTTLIIRFPCVP